MPLCHRHKPAQRAKAMTVFFALCEKKIIQKFILNLILLAYLSSKEFSTGNNEVFPSSHIQIQIHNQPSIQMSQ
jgi:hypothetical protein